MSSVGEKAREAVRLGRAYVASSRGSRSRPAPFSAVETYCSFIGTSRSGTSVIGALLDAHPNAVIASGIGDLKYVQAGFGRLRLYRLLLEDAHASAKVGRHRPPTPYSYEVPGLWQGRFERIRVIGDKQAEGVTLRLQARPWLLDRLRRTVRVPIRLVHVVRNPFDNISTMAIRATTNGSPPDLQAAVDDYFALCEAVLRVKESAAEEEIVEVRYERFIDDPVATLRELALSLGLTPTPEYLQRCANAVWKSPRQSRHEVEWSPDLTRQVLERSEGLPFLLGHRFEA
jgi:hypothetical protein